jgi:hypothetical protein
VCVCVSERETEREREKERERETATTSMTATFWFLMRGCQITYKISYLWKLKKWNCRAYNHCTCILCIVVQLDEMYDMCRFDKAWDLRHTSPWCAVFSKEELQVCVTKLHDFYFLVYMKCIQNTATFKLHVDSFNTQVPISLPGLESSIISA